MSTDHKPFNGHTPEELSEAYWATPEGRAVKRWPADKSMDGRTNLTLTKRNIRQGYARCIREEVEPREAELSSFRESLKMCVEALDAHLKWTCHMLKIDKGWTDKDCKEVFPEAFAALSHVKASHPNL